MTDKTTPRRTGPTLLRIVRQRPGLSTRDLMEAIDSPCPKLTYAALRRLEARGLVRREASQQESVGRYTWGDTTYPRSREMPVVRWRPHTHARRTSCDGVLPHAT